MAHLVTSTHNLVVDDEITIIPDNPQHPIYITGTASVSIVHYLDTEAVGFPEEANGPLSRQIPFMPHSSMYGSQIKVICTSPGTFVYGKIDSTS